MGWIQKLFGRRSGKTLSGMLETRGEIEKQIREAVGIKEAPANRLEAMREIARQRHLGRVKRQRYYDRRSRGPKRRIRTLERYREGRATAESFAEFR